MLGRAASNCSVACIACCTRRRNRGPICCIFVVARLIRLRTWAHFQFEAQAAVKATAIHWPDSATIWQACLIEANRKHRPAISRVRSAKAQPPFEIEGRACAVFAGNFTGHALSRLSSIGVGRGSVLGYDQVVRTRLPNHQLQMNLQSFPGRCAWPSGRTTSRRTTLWLTSCRVGLRPEWIAPKNPAGYMNEKIYITTPWAHSSAER